MAEEGKPRPRKKPPVVQPGTQTRPRKPKPAPEPEPEKVPDGQHGPFASYTEITLKNGSVIGLAPGETYLEE